MIHVAADQNLYKIKELIPPGARLSLYDPSHGIPDLTDTDALLVRTVTHINADTLPNPPARLKFIGTGSSGTDHLDSEYLENKGIFCTDANGCNARAVAEYVLTALLLWQHQFHPKKDIGRLGVIGVGKAGSAVIDLLSEFDIDYVAYDPPREKREAGFNSASLEQVLDCDILTFHVPLNRKGNYPTYHWLNEQKLNGRSFRLIINAARGGVIDELAMMKAFVEGTVEQYVLDVWENEPDFNTEVAKHAFIATPHIAGYSEQAKINASKIVCDKMADYFGLEPASSALQDRYKTVDLPAMDYDFQELLTRLHPIRGYDKALRDLASQPNKKILFRDLRNEWTYRFEYPALQIRSELLNEFPALKKLGIDTV